MWEMAYGFVIARLRERSTWAGLISTLGVKLGLHLSGDQMTDLTNLGLALVVVIVAFVPDRKPDPSHPPLV